MVEKLRKLTRERIKRGWKLKRLFKYVQGKQPYWGETCVMLFLVNNGVKCSNRRMVQCMKSFLPYNETLLTKAYIISELEKNRL